MRDIDQLSYRKVSPPWCVGDGSKWKTPYFGVPKGFFSYPNLGVSAKMQKHVLYPISESAVLCCIILHIYIYTCVHRNIKKLNLGVLLIWMGHCMEISGWSLRKLEGTPKVIFPTMLGLNKNRNDKPIFGGLMMVICKLVGGFKQEFYFLY